MTVLPFLVGDRSLNCPGFQHIKYQLWLEVCVITRINSVNWLLPTETVANSLSLWNKGGSVWLDFVVHNQQRFSDSLWLNFLVTAKRLFNSCTDMYFFAVYSLCHFHKIFQLQMNDEDCFKMMFEVPSPLKKKCNFHRAVCSCCHWQIVEKQ